MANNNETHLCGSMESWECFNAGGPYWPCTAYIKRQCPMYDEGHYEEKERKEAEREGKRK